MTSTTPVLEQVSSLLAGLCASDEIAGQFESQSPAELVQLLHAVGAVQRRVDAIVTTLS